MKRLRRSTTSTSSANEEQQRGHTPKWRELSSASDAGDSDTSTASTTSEEEHSHNQSSTIPAIEAKEEICPTCHTSFVTPTPPHPAPPSSTTPFSADALTASHLLELHFTERHDPLAAVKRDERGEKIYRCLVPDCDKVCSEVRKRRWHVEAKHPGLWGDMDKDWALRGTRRTGGPPRRSARIENKREKMEKGRKGRKGVEQDGSGEKVGGVEGEQGGGDEQVGEGGRSIQQKEDDGMEGLTSGLTALKFVPPSVRFGRGGRRGGLAKG